MKSIILILLWGWLAVGFAAPVQSHHAALARKKAAAGGSGAAWIDSMDPGTVDTADVYGEYPKLAPITADQTGNVTKVRIWIANYYSGGSTLKAGLYDSSRNLLSSGSVTIGAAGWLEVPITSQAVTASTVYRVGWVFQTPGSANGAHLSGGAANSSDINFSGSYAASMENPFTAGGTTFRFPVGIYITP